MELSITGGYQILFGVCYVATVICACISYCRYLGSKE